MHEYIETLNDICEVMMKELEKANDKIKMSGGEVSGSDIEYLDRLTHGIKSIKTTIAMMEAEDDGYSYDDMSYNNSYRGMRGNSYARMGRGRGSNARRDSRGRYSSRGYSMDGGMIDELKELMHEAPDEQTKREFQKFINKMESM